jgi:hypothetical protein
VIFRLAGILPRYSEPIERPRSLSAERPLARGDALGRQRAAVCTERACEADR